MLGIKWEIKKIIFLNFIIMHNNVELLSALVNPKKYFEHILDLKIEKY